ncbi:hypothetical protein BCV69DRAFT_20469 [Microstroma glucosiphilum]|uniref:Uncharacterized protein n=1 Tax=Pseudomicrostroma glucosiphilum TaxID=1684307 RepID=A0A316UFW3_9BASI|nr:hypothetical protein BCV69DRAFT_20469 [Pseudomicrostroma glucosiphilum]PWN24120.1 hypothetical protein BCV69DRAFT_20469 [Pseudomicrostroma glucosiphilum]
MDIDAAIKSAHDGASQRGAYAIYVLRMPHLDFELTWSVHLDSTSLTAVVDSDGFLHRVRPGTRRQRDGTVEESTNERVVTSWWERELAHDYDEEMHPSQKILVFDFGQLARETHAAGAQTPDNQRGKSKTLCYPSGLTLAALQRSGHMLMRPFREKGCFDEGSTPDSEDAMRNWEGIDDDVWVPRSVACQCVPVWRPAG